jgi:hypothetical protein
MIFLKHFRSALQQEPHSYDFSFFEHHMSSFLTHMVINMFPPPPQVRPKHPLGYLELELELVLAKPVAAALLQVPRKEEESDGCKKRQGVAPASFPFPQPSSSQHRGSFSPSSSASNKGSRKQRRKERAAPPKAATATAADSRSKKNSKKPDSSQFSSSSSSSSSCEEEDDENDDEEEGYFEKKVDPRVLGGNLERLHRCFVGPDGTMEGGLSPLLAAPYHWRVGLLLPLLARLCFFAPNPFSEAPLWVFVVVALHGALSRNKNQLETHDSLRANHPFQQQQEQQQLSSPDSSSTSSSSTTTTRAAATTTPVPGSWSPASKTAGGSPPPPPPDCVGGIGDTPPIFSAPLGSKRAGCSSSPSSSSSTTPLHPFSFPSALKWGGAVSPPPTFVLSPWVVLFEDEV